MSNAKIALIGFCVITILPNKLQFGYLHMFNFAPYSDYVGKVKVSLSIWFAIRKINAKLFLCAHLIGNDFEPPGLGSF